MVNDEEKLKWLEKMMKANSIRKATIILLPKGWMGLVHAGDTTYSNLNMRLMSDGSLRYS